MGTNNISTRISLEGAEDLQRALRDLATAGEQSLKRLQDAVKQTTLDPQQTGAALEKLQAELAQFGDTGKKALDQIKQSLANQDTRPAVAGWKSLSEAIRDVSGKAGEFLGVEQNVAGGLGRMLVSAGGIAGALAAAGALVVAFAHSSAEAVLRIDQMARGLGLTTEQYQGMSKAAQQAGVEQDKFNTGMNRFVRELDKEGREQFTTLADVAKQVATSFQSVGVGVQKSFADLQKLREVAAQVAPQLRALFAQSDSTGGKILAALPDAAFVDRVARMAQADETLRASLVKLGLTPPSFSVLESLDRLVAKAQPTLAALGVSALDLNGKIKNSFQAFIEWADKVTSISDKSEQARRVIEFFGRQAGPEMVKFIQQGTHSITEWIEKLKEVGVAIRPEDVKSAEALRKQWDDLATAWEALKRRLGGVFVNPVTALLEGINKLIDDVRGAIALLTGDNEKAASLFGQQWSQAATIAEVGVAGVVAVIAVKLVQAIGLAAKAMAVFVSKNPWVLAIAGAAALAAWISGVGDEVNKVGGEFSGLAGEGQKLVDGIKTGGQAAAGAMADAKAKTDDFHGSLKQVGGTLPGAFKAATGEAAGFGKTVDGVKASLDALGKSAGGDTLKGRLDAAFKDTSAAAEQTKTSIEAIGKQGDFAAALTAYAQKLSALKAQAVDLGDAIKTALSGGTPAGAADLGGQGPGANQASAIVAPFQSAVDQVRALWADLAAFIADPANFSGVAALADLLAAPFRTAADAIRATFQGLAADVSSIFAQIVASANQAVAAINAIGAAAGGASSSSFDPTAGSGATFAAGGQVAGPGTATSDSILAWLSNGEFVQPTARVMQYGRDFMEAIRHGALPTNSVRSLMQSLRGFRSGGLVERLAVSFSPLAVPIPSFAEGGPVAGAGALAPLHPVHLHWGDGSTTAGLHGTPSAVRELSRRAAFDRFASLGPAPGFAK